MSIDLHCHTKMSDGAASIDEVIALAKKAELKVISITDHDTFAGSTRGTIIGNRMGLTVVPGVEISCSDSARNGKAHILCYYPENPNRLEGTLKRICDSRKRAMMISIQKVMRMYPISAEMVLRRAQGSTNIFKQHVMQALMDAGYTNEMFGSLYQKLYHPKFGLAYTKVTYPDVHDVIEEIHDAGGLAVLAHPSEYSNIELLEEMAEKHEIDGVELNHPRNTDEDKIIIQDIASKNKLFVTGGTDFHGCYSKTFNPIGTYLTDNSQYLLMKKAKKNITKE